MSLLMNEVMRKVQGGAEFAPTSSTPVFSVGLGIQAPTFFDYS
jgi:hypothetical protein